MGFSYFGYEKVMDICYPFLRCFHGSGGWWGIAGFKKPFVLNPNMFQTDYINIDNKPFNLHIFQAADDEGAFCWISTLFQSLSDFFFASEDDEGAMLSISEDTDEWVDLPGPSGIVWFQSLWVFFFASLHPAGFQHLF